LIRGTIMETTTLTPKTKKITHDTKLETILQRRDVTTILNYYREPGDGSPPLPVYVGGYAKTSYIWNIFAEQ
jgi:hypothetical protein